MKTPVRVAITGAAGQISYSIIFRIASGDMLGKDQPVILQLLEIPPAMDALNGVVMELNDCAFPLVAGIVPTDDPNVAFKDTDYAVLVGARPRGPGSGRGRGRYRHGRSPPRGEIGSHNLRHRRDRFLRSYGQCQ